MRAALIRAAGEAAKVIDVTAPPVAISGGSRSELVFDLGGFRSVIPAEVAAALDVRDRADLDALATERRRGMILWRTAMGAVAACLLFALD